MLRRIPLHYLPLAVTGLVALLLWAGCAARYPGFGTARVAVNLLGDNSFLGILAIGMTFVILGGGIDLSVGSVTALCSVSIALILERTGAPPAVAIAASLALGILFGLAAGCVIQVFETPPFIVTLAAMFLARGLAFVLHAESIPIRHAGYRALSQIALPLGPVALPITAIAFLAVVAAGVLVAGYTPFGRNVYAVGGNEEAARLMGLPVGRTKIAMYSLSGLCAGAAAVVFTCYQLSGNPAAGVGWELDAIAAVVIGGTLLTGGVGHVAGTLAGVLIFGIIQTAISFQGTLSSWWTKVVIGGLMLLFIFVQKLLSRLASTAAAAASEPGTGPPS